MIYKNSNDISIEITPWTNTGYKFTKINMIESIGGSIATGEIVLESDGSKESLELITKEYTGKLIIKDEKDGGFVYEIELFLTKKSYIKNYLTLTFLCIKDKKFITDLLISEWDDINSAIKSLYQGKVDIRVNSDVGNGIKIFQGAETSYSLCTKLAMSFKRGIIFAYGWEGFLLKDVVGEGEPNVSMGPQSGIFNITPYELEYDKFLYNIPVNPWSPEDGEESDVTPLYNSNLTDYSNYYCIGVKYEPLLMNYLFNKRYTKNTLYSSIKTVIRGLPPYKLGDVIVFKDMGQKEKLPFDTYLVSENRFFMSIEGSKDRDEHGFDISMTSIMLGIKEGDLVLPDEDPTNNSEE